MTLLEQVADVNSLHRASLKARVGCDWKHSVQAFDLNNLYEIQKLHNELINRTYQPMKYFEFTLHERGKIREIKACNIRDRVVQKSLCDEILNPTLKKYLIYDNGASLEGKGIDFSRKRLEVHVNKYFKKYKTNKGYVLQIDFSKFFDSIPHGQLIEMVEDKLADDSLNWLIERIIASFGGDRGLGIGSQISQICGLFYPTRIDTYCKVVKGLKYYGRYMDDIYIIHPDKKFLGQLLNEIEEIATELGLTINRKKTAIVKLDKQFLFLKTKYTLLEDGSIIKKMHRDSITRERRKLKKYYESRLPYEVINNAYHSWRGNAYKYDSKKSIEALDRVFDKYFIEPFITGEYIERERNAFKSKLEQLQV